MSGVGIRFTRLDWEILTSVWKKNCLNGISIEFWTSFVLGSKRGGGRGRGRRRMPRGGVEEGRGRRIVAACGVEEAEGGGARRGGGRRRRGTTATSSGGSSDGFFCQHLPCNWLLSARVDVLGGGEGAELIGRGSSVPGRGIARDRCPAINAAFTPLGA